jgi:hypothetical protein
MGVREPTPPPSEDIRNPTSTPAPPPELKWLPKVPRVAAAVYIECEHPECTNPGKVTCNGCGWLVCDGCYVQHHRGCNGVQPEERT